MDSDADLSFSFTGIAGAAAGIARILFFADVMGM